ncbi:MAG: T9SS type A sorting domain-containing protein, partial [Imperialibacter sp.]
KRILLAGRFDMINDVSHPYGLALLDQNGNVDPSFSGTALSTVIDAEAFQKVFDAAFDPTLNRVAVIVRDTLQQNAIIGVELDGTLSSEFSKIVLSENFLSQHTLSYGNGRFIYSMDFGATYEGVLYTFLAFDGSGTIDTSVSGNERLFGAGVVNTAVELDGGDIIIGGSFTHVDNIEVKNLARLNASGQPNQVFNSNNPLAVDDVVEKLEIDQNGDIYLGGMFRNILGQPKVPLLRMSDAGVLDESFVVHLFSLGSEVFLKDFILMDDRIIFCGQFSNYVQAVDKSGVLISDFNTSLFPGVAAQVFSLCTIDQDNFAMSGAVNNVAAFLWAMDKNGNYNQNYLRQDSIDFSPNDIVKIGDALYNSGKLTHGGSDDGNVVYKYDLQTGDIIETGLFTFYSPGLSDNRHLLAINDSTVLLSGNFKKLNNVAVNDLAGSSLDGSVNERWLFNVSPDALEYSVNKTHLLSGNRVLAMGRFKSIEGLPAYSLAMLSAENFEPVVSYDATITVNEDTTFNLFDYITIVDLDDEASITVFDNEHFEVGSSGMLSLASNYFGTTQIEFEVSDPLTTVGPFEITLNVQSVDDALGIFDREKQSAVSVFPNPAAESFSISSVEKILRVTVFSLSGARVRNVRFEKTSNSDYLVRLNGVHQGVYIVRAELESGQTVESRLIVD